MAFSAAVVTLWGIVRLLASSTVRRHGAESSSSRSTALPTPQKVGTLPTPPTPASQVLSPVPVLRTPPNAEQSHPPAPQRAQEPTESRQPETPQAKDIHPSQLPTRQGQQEVHETSKQVKETPVKQNQPKESKESETNGNKRSLKASGKKQPSLELSSDSRVERIDCATLASWLSKGDHPTLVDVRSDDYKGGNVKGSRHLSYAKYQSGQDMLEELKPQKDEKIVFFCMYGKEQSPAAAQNFASVCDPAHRPQVYVLHGGFQAWLRYCARADLSVYIDEYDRDLWVEKDGGLVYRADLPDSEPVERAPTLRNMRMQSSTLRLNLDENHRFEWVDCPTLGLWLASNDKPVLVDVRSEDFKGGHIPRAMHIPFASFSTRMEEVDAAIRDNTGERKNIIVFYCLVGEESSPTCAMKFLTKHTDPSTKVYVLRRGFQEWLNFCLHSTPMSADRVVEYDPEKWIKQDKLGYVYKTYYTA